MPGTQTDPRVDAYIEKAAPFAQPILAHLRNLIHQACPRISESVKWGMPFFVQQDVILCHMAAFKHHCAFGFWGKDMQNTLAKDGLKSSEAMGVLGRITSLKGLPPDKALLTYMRQAANKINRPPCQAQAKTRRDSARAFLGAQEKQACRQGLFRLSAR